MKLIPPSTSMPGRPAPSGGFGPARKSPGRPKGALGKKTRSLTNAARAMLKDGMSPLEFLLTIIHDEEEATERRLSAAIAAAPYVHKRMPAAMSLDFPKGLPVLVVRREG